MTEKMFPTEFVELPSKGVLYPESSPLRSGQVEIYYPTAKTEDILTNQNYIEKGIVIDKFLQSLIVDKTIDFSELLIGDKNALLVASRILGYGKNYEIEYQKQPYVVDLSEVENKPLHEQVLQAKENSFIFTLPSTGVELKFKLLTHKDEQLIDQEIKGLKKISKEGVSDTSVRYRYMILAVDGVTELKQIREFIETRFLALDARAFRKYIQEIQPDIDLRFYPENGPEGGVTIPIGVSFLWPDFGA